MATRKHVGQFAPESRQPIGDHVQLLDEETWFY